MEEGGREGDCVAEVATKNPSGDRIASAALTMDSGGNDGWRRAPQDPEGDPRAYQGYGGGATSANGGSKYGAYDAHQHQHQEGNANDSYQGQTHYDNAGAHGGGYYQGYPEDAGYSNRGFQTQVRFFGLTS